MSILEKIMEGQMMQNIKNKIPGIFIAVILAVTAVGIYFVKRYAKEVK